MGCFPSKSLTNTPSLDKLKRENRYVKGNNGVRPNGQRQQGKGPEIFIKQEVVVTKRVAAVNGRNGVGEGEVQKAVVREGERKNGRGKMSQRAVPKKIGGDEPADGWPKWLVDNISKEVLAGLVPKSADSYDKLAKVRAS